MSSVVMQTATGFWASKVLLTAVEFDLFSTLGDGSMTAEELGAALGLHPRGRYDFFDALVALGFLHRDGDGPESRYRNTPETAAFLVKQSPAYIGGMSPGAASLFAPLVLSSPASASIAARS